MSGLSDVLRPDEKLKLGHAGLTPQARATLQATLGNRPVIVDSEVANGLNAGSAGPTSPTTVPYYPTTTSGGSGSSDSFPVTQTAHGLSVGQVVRFNGTNYVTALADSVVDAEVVGIVSAVASANAFTLTTAGLVTGLTGLTAGSTYFLDTATAGNLSTTDPNVSGSAGQVSKPLGNAISTTALIFDNWRGDLLTSSPVAGFQTISLLSATSGINGKTVANTSLFTPSGKTAVVTMLILVCTAAVAITVGPTAGLGTNATPSNIYAQTALTALLTTSQAYSYAAPGVMTIATTGVPILLGITNAATGTSQTFTAYLYGFQF